MMTQPNQPAADDAASIDTIEQSQAVEMALRHVKELIDIAHELNCEMSSLDSPEVIFRTSTRLATLLHSALREIDVGILASDRLMKMLDDCH